MKIVFVRGHVIVSGAKWQLVARDTRLVENLL